MGHLECHWGLFAISLAAFGVMKGGLLSLTANDRVGLNAKNLAEADE